MLNKMTCTSGATGGGDSKTKTMMAIQGLMVFLVITALGLATFKVFAFTSVGHGEHITMIHPLTGPEVLLMSAGVPSGTFVPLPDAYEFDECAMSVHARPWSVAGSTRARNFSAFYISHTMVYSKRKQGETLWEYITKAQWNEARTSDFTYKKQYWPFPDGSVYRITPEPETAGWTILSGYKGVTIWRPAGYFWDPDSRIDKNDKKIYPEFQLVCVKDVKDQDEA